MKYLGLACALALAACDESVSTKGVLGSYDVMISSMGKSDPDIMSISVGSNSALLITFIAGITTDPTGPNADGLRASFGDGNTLHLDKQPAHIDHSTGVLNGTIYGDGTALNKMVMLTLHYLPTNFAIPQPTTGDGGIVLTRDAGTTTGGPATTLDYVVSGTHE
jgi:hypothetical protein